MNRATTHLIAAALGAALFWFILARDTVPGDEFRAVQEASVRAEALSLDLAAESRLWAGKAARAQDLADSLRNVRKSVRTAVIASPDSTARALGLTVTVPDTGTRCLPAVELAELLASRAELGLADYAAAYDLSAMAACGEALALSDSSGEVVRKDAAIMRKTAQELAHEVETAKRSRWWWAAGGAAVAVLAIIAGGAL